MSPRESPLNDFGLLIAYLIPGFAVLWGISYFSPEVRHWIGTSAPDGPSLAGFLYVTVASLAAGLTTSTVRWLTLDMLHHRTGIPPPRWDFSVLGPNVLAFDTLIRIHYHFYLFHSNGLFALIFVNIARRSTWGLWTMPDFADLGFLVLAVVLFLASRDNLKRYYTRTGQLLSDGHAG